MAKYVGTIPNLIQGVSQQPAKERIPGQLTSQFNMVSNPVRGLSRRAGSKMVRTNGSYVEGTFFYTYRRDNDETYTISITPAGVVEVYDLAGDTIALDAAPIASIVTYLTTTGDLSAVTIGDTTLIANTGVQVAMTAATAPALAQGGILKHFIWFTGVEYGRKYRLYSGTTLLSEYLTPSTVTVSATEQQAAATLDPNDAIAAIIAGWVGATGWAIAGPYDDGVAVVTNASAVIADLRTEGGSEFKLVTNQKIATIGDLPPIGYDDMVIEVDNSRELNEDNYYLKYSTDVSPSPNNKGKWVETVKPLTLTTIDWTTMPIAIRQKTEGGNFFVEYPNQDEGSPYWEERTVGDNTTNTIPSFVGKRILAMGSFQDRLFFEAEDSWVLSQTDSYWSFWKHTALTDRDDDRIDVIAPSATVNILKSSAMYNRNLVLFSEGTQYIQSGDQPLTPKTVNLGVSTSYDMDLTCRPEATGDAILFCTKFGEFTKVQSFRLEDLTNLERATPLTDHVPRYIPKNVEQIASSSALTTAVLRCKDDKGLYVYQWYLSGNEYVQQAWHKWELKNHQVKHMYISNATLVVFAKRDTTGELDILTISLTTQDTEDYIGVLPLDNFQYIPKEDWTLDGDKYVMTPTIDIQYADMLIVRAATSGDSGGMLIRADWSGTQWETTAFTSGPEDSFIGSEYESSFQPGMPYIKNSQGEAMTDGTLTLESIDMNVRESGEILVGLDYKYHDTIDMAVNAPVVGIFNIGLWSVQSGAVPVPIYAVNTEVDMTVKSLLHLPMTVIDMMWRGQYRQEGKWI